MVYDTLLVKLLWQSEWVLVYLHFPPLTLCSEQIP